MNKTNNTRCFSDNLVSWYTHINYGMLKPLKWQMPLLKVLSYALTGKCSRVLISAPPQHGKTVLTVETFVSYYMVNNPDDEVMVTAYDQQRATRYGFKIRSILERFSRDSRYKPQLSKFQRSRNEFVFDYPYKGGLLANGGFGGLMGYPANLQVIDDMIKGLREANSPTMQENLQDLVVGTLNTRLRKNDAGRRPIQLIIAQRLHKKDLHGIMMDKYNVIDGLDAMQKVLDKEYIENDTILSFNFPALCETPETDILHRNKGEALWSKHKSTNDLLIDRKMMGDYQFKTIMQGDPQNITDYLFTNEMFYDDENKLNCLIDYKEVPPVPVGRFWDTAAKSNNTSKINKHGDYYSGIQVGYEAMTEKFYIFHHLHGRNKPLAVANLIKATAVNDGFEKFTYLAQEPGSMSPMFIETLQDSLQGYRLYWMTERDNKAFRSMLLQSVCNRHGLKFVVGDKSNISSNELDWINNIIKELLSFDGEDSNASKGKHDDIVDSLSSAVNFYYLNKHMYPNY